MWSISLSRLPGSILARRTTLLASAMLVAVFTILLPAAHTVGAQGLVDTVTWSGDNLSLQLAEGGSTSLSRSTVPPRDNPNIPNLIGSECQDNPNIFFSAPGTWTDDDEYSWLYIVCLSAGDDGSDKSQPLPAMLLKYRAPLGTDRAAEFNEREEPGTAITISAATSDSDGAETITTCDSTYTHGLGWAICPITNWLAAGMDALYNILIGFLSVPPLTTDREGPIYYMWGLMRNAANILFIAGFLIIIYSQTTSIGLSNYGIKRLLPRLAIAAILVNTSYWVAALAVDASNILGVSLQNLLIGVRESIPASEGASFDTSRLSWQAIATAVLTGGSASIFVVGTAVGSLMATAGGSLWFLLVGLAGVMLSVLVAILILAARQALITILIIISPLAFVAYLLPATESYFQRWRSLFTTMLVMFPIFSLIFGGSQLAGLAIIHTADPGNDNFFTVVILGMIVQVAPVIITPMLIKLSGSLLGRIAGFVNNPNRGIVDQTRKFAQRRQDMTKNRQMWDFDKKTGRFRNNNPLAQAARWNALRTMNDAQKLKTWEGTADAYYAQDRRSHDTHRQSAISEMMKSEGEDAAKAEFAKSIARERSLRRLYAQQQLSQEESESATTMNKADFEARRTNPLIENDVATRALYNRAQEISNEKRIQATRQSNIELIREEDFFKELNTNADWQKRAGAEEVDEFGAFRVRTNAQAKLMAASSERVGNYEKKFIFENTSRDDILVKATGVGVADSEEWEAAVKSIIDSKSSNHIIRLTEQIDLTKAPESIRQTLASTLSGSPMRPVYATQGRLGDEVPQGKVKIHGPQLVDEWMIDATIKHKYDTSALAEKASKDEVERLYKALITNGGRSRLGADNEARLAADIKRAFKDEEMYRQLGDKLKPLQELGKELGLRNEDFRPGSTSRRT